MEDLSYQRKNPPLCPWCGTEMSPCTYETTKEGWVGYCKCVECDAESPYVIHCDSWEDAVKKAHRKATERMKLKPLTLFEVEEICKNGSHSSLWYDEDTSVESDNDFVDLSEVTRWIGDHHGAREYYGRTWRCWTRKPTEEERRAAPWEI